MTRLSLPETVAVLAIARPDAAMLGRRVSYPLQLVDLGRVLRRSFRALEGPGNQHAAPPERATPPGRPPDPAAVGGVPSGDTNHIEFGWNVGGFVVVVR